MAVKGQGQAISCTTEPRICRTVGKGRSEGDKAAKGCWIRVEVSEEMANRKAAAQPNDVCYYIDDCTMFLRPFSFSIPLKKSEG